MHRQLDAVIPEVRKGIARLPASEREARSALLQQLRDLEALRTLNDPTLRLETPAEPNPTQVSPRPVLSLAAAIVAGLLIGVAAALGMQLFDPRLQREEQLRRYRIPILARVRLERGRSRPHKALPRLPGELSPVSRDSYLLLGATLSVNPAGDQQKRSVLVTGPSAGDGKTTTAVNVASALAESQRVALVETDTRRPSLARLLGLPVKIGLTNLIASRGNVQDSLLQLGPSAPGVQLVAHRTGEAPLSAVLTSETARWLIRQVQTAVDWVVIDAAPVTLVPDALPLAQEVDHVIVVVRLGNTKLKALEQLAELLQQQGIVPSGFVLIGGRGATAYYDSY
jgi:receptor protein-tyrosine kinase